MSSVPNRCISVFARRRPHREREGVTRVHGIDMPPELTGQTRTVACRLESWIPDATVLADIRTAVHRVHAATIHVTNLV